VRGPDGLDAGSAAADDRGNEGRVTQSGVPHLDGGGPDFGRMIEALRLAQERITAASPPDEVVAETAGLMENLAALPWRRCPGGAAVAAAVRAGVR
jgi:hypothetical protein